MNRKYKVEDFLKIVEKFKKEISNLELWTDIIVGFPRENDEDFQETLEAIRKIKPDLINISRFWVRRGTEAEKMPQLDRELVKKRIKKLLEEYNKIKEETKQN